MTDTFVSPKWARELLRFLSVKSQFLLWGNVYDVYPLEIEEGVVATYRLCDFLQETLKHEGYSLIVKYEPIIGFSLLEGTPDLFEKATGMRIDENGGPIKASLSEAAKAIEQLVGADRGSCAVLLNFSSRLGDLCGKEAQDFYYYMFRLGGSASPGIPSTTADGDPNPSIPPSPRYNPVIWILDKENDLPAWFALDNQRLRVLPLPKPDHEIRRRIAESVSPMIAGYNDMEESRREEMISIFVSQTSGLFAEEIVSIGQLARKEEIPFGDIGDAIRGYKIGVVENLWAKLDFQRIARAEERLGERVKGQEHAIRHAANILKRSVFNLSGAQFSRYSQRPKGVLFFAGPTGVGKTELAKAITELVFGSPTNYIRFDMSEFGQEHSDQRLIGAPPGYVGYDVGGELTNAVKQNPFSVVLFDEIEKANPKILDMFLQILDDGRLSSGRGETVYFSECLIVFTSNLGIYEKQSDGRKVQKVSPEMDYGKVTESIIVAIDDFFKYEINRPEILNRIGKNIVVFDFIRPETAERIFETMLGNILFRLEDTHGIILDIDEEIKKKLIDYVCSDLSMGGRGIGNNLEEILVNPLSRALFDEKIHSGENERIRLEEIQKNEEGWSVRIKRNVK